MFYFPLICGDFVFCCCLSQRFLSDKLKIENSRKYIDSYLAQFVLSISSPTYCAPFFVFVVFFVCVANFVCCPVVLVVHDSRSWRCQNPLPSALENKRILFYFSVIYYLRWILTWHISIRHV